MGLIGVGIRGGHIPALMGRIASLIGVVPNGPIGDGLPDVGGVLVYNAAGTTLAAGDLVFLAGLDATSGCRKAYKAQSGVTGKVATYVVLESIASAALGAVALGGVVTTTLDTSLAAVGDSVYLSTTAGAPTLTGAATSQVVGAVASLSATASRISYDLTSRSTQTAAMARVSVLTAAGTPLTNNATEKVLASATVAANSIKAGTRVVIEGKCRVTADAGATTLTPRLRIGPTTLTGTAVLSGTATDTAAADIFWFRFVLTGRAAPDATASCVGTGQFNQLAAAGNAVVTASLNATNFATNGALLVELTGQWSAADGNSVQAEEFSVDIFDA